MLLEGKNKASLFWSAPETSGTPNTCIFNGVICWIYYPRNAKLMTRHHLHKIAFKEDLLQKGIYLLNTNTDYIY